MVKSEVSQVAGTADPADDPKAFRTTLGQFATGVTAIATATDQGPVGVTANSFSSLSLDPPLVLWSIARTSRSFAAFSEASHFAISVLAEDQIAVSQALSSKNEDKFASLAWQAGIGGSPVITGAIATLECSTEAVHDGGDHIILVGRVLRHGRHAGRPLVYAQGQYAVVDEHPAARQQGSGVVTSGPASDLASQSLTTLLYLAHHASSLAFERHRRAENISLAQSRILSELKRNPGQSRQSLVGHVYLVEDTVGEALSQLEQRACVLADGEGLYRLTTEGDALAQSIRRRVEAYEAQQFAGIPADRLAVTRDVLIRFIEGLADQAETGRAA